MGTGLLHCRPLLASDDKMRIHDDGVRICRSFAPGRHTDGSLAEVHNSGGLESKYKNMDIYCLPR